MEMADYERLVKELNGKLTEKDESVEELKVQMRTLTQKEETLKQEAGTDCLFLCKMFFSLKKALYTFTLTFYHTELL